VCISTFSLYIQERSNKDTVEATCKVYIYTYIYICLITNSTRVSYVITYGMFIVLLFYPPDVRLLEMRSTLKYNVLRNIGIA
jgi:hypothetical protein